jgi:hypothetical protein
MQATARMASVVSATPPARRRLIRDVMSMKKRNIKRIILISIVVLIGLVGAFIPWPGDVKEYSKKDVVTHAVETLLHNRRVWTSSWMQDSSGWRRLLDTGYVKDNGRVYFKNELKIPDEVFLNLGLKQIPKDRKLDVNAGDVLWYIAWIIYNCNIFRNKKI